MKVKAIKDIDTALRIYYSYTELTNKHIKELFGGIADTTVARYKKSVLDAQAANNIKTSQHHTIDTETAFEVWGIDVEKLERRRAKLRKLGLEKESA